jgi:hypothetical protein
MKINTTPKTCTNNRASVGEFDWQEIRDTFSSKPYLSTREIVFFAHSDSVMNSCIELLDSKNLVFNNFNSFNSAIRIGVANTADIIVLVDNFASASNANLTKLMRSRSPGELQVITWNNSSAKELVLSIQNALSSIDQIETKQLVVEQIVESRTPSLRPKHNELIRNEMMLSEKDLRDLLEKELEGHKKFDPEIILAKAIQVIKELK